MDVRMSLLSSEEKASMAAEAPSAVGKTNLPALFSTAATDSLFSSAKAGRAANSCCFDREHRPREIANPRGTHQGLHLRRAANKCRIEGSPDVRLWRCCRAAWEQGQRRGTKRSGRRWWALADYDKGGESKLKWNFKFCGYFAPGALPLFRKVPSRSSVKAC